MRTDGWVADFMKALMKDTPMINHWNEEPDGLGKYNHSFCYDY
jgi:hypothetical protein